MFRTKGTWPRTSTLYCHPVPAERSQIVFTTARGEMVFWQSPRTRKQARPEVRLPTARAAGLPGLEILVGAHERYPYGFGGQQVRTRRHDSGR